MCSFAQEKHDFHPPLTAGDGLKQLFLTIVVLHFRQHISTSGGGGGGGDVVYIWGGSETIGHPCHK